MRQVTLGPQPDPSDAKATLAWLVMAVREFENASTEDPIAVADSYSANSTFTTTRQVNVTAPTVANLATVLSSFFADLKRRGIHKTT
jgi:hypothetical protein